MTDTDTDTDTRALIEKARDPLYGEPDADHAHKPAVACPGCLFTADAQKALLRALAGRLQAQQEVVDAAKAFLSVLSLHGCCPAENCESEDADGLDGLREPEPHSDGCSYVAVREALARVGER